MEVSQLIDLARWYLHEVPPVIDSYQKLVAVLEHNATQPQKQPVRDSLDELLQKLKSLPMERLTSEQVGKLEELEVLHLLGIAGAEYVNKTVTQGEYDPASTASDIKAAHQILIERRKQLNGANSALEALDFEEYDASEFAADPVLRVHFQDEASITDVTLLKRWASDWYDITRGVALVVKQSPSEVRVVGASNGSIILTLVTTLGVMRILAAIAKQAGSIVQEGLVSVRKEVA